MKKVTSNIIFVILFLQLFPDISFSQSAFKGCYVLYPEDSCFAVYDSLKHAMLSRPQNIYRLQRAFYPIGKFASSRLINVFYNITFGEELPLNHLDACIGTDKESVSNIIAAATVNSSNSSSTGLGFLTGWTSADVFNILTPLQLSEIQLQLSNEVFSLFVIPGSGIYLPGLFGWVVKDKYDQRVNLQDINMVNLTIHVDNISCVPDLQLIKSALIDITTMLKVWASSDGLIPEEIDEDKLGYVTEPGIETRDQSTHILVEFDPFFSVLITTISFLLGLSSIPALGFAFPKIGAYLRKDQQEEFNLYFLATSVSAAFVSLLFILIDLMKLPEWCSTEHFDYIQSIRKTGCDGTIVVKILFICSSIPLSFMTAVLSAKTSKKLSKETQSAMQLTKRTTWVYITCATFIFLAFSLGAWSFVPTLLQIFVYPSVILTLTLVTWATIFWFTVMFTIPLLLYKNIKNKSKCVTNFYYVSPFLAMVVLVFIFGLVTITYMDAIIFGTQIGNLVGILVATVPSFLLTIFTEFYRDLFLTSNDGTLKKENEDADTTEDKSGITIELQSTNGDKSNGREQNFRNASLLRRVSSFKF